MKRIAVSIVIIILVSAGVLLVSHYRNGVNVGEWKEIYRATDINRGDRIPPKEYAKRKKNGSSELVSPVTLTFRPFKKKVVLTDGKGDKYECEYERDYSGSGDPPTKEFRSTGASFEVHTLDGKILMIRTYNYGAQGPGFSPEKTKLSVVEIRNGKQIRKIQDPDDIVLARIM